MTINKLTLQGAVLDKVICHQYEGARASSISALTFLFKDQSQINLSVENDTDELAWETPSDEALRSIDLQFVFPSIASAYGLSLAWCWEMKNHQGYFDALQLELVDSTLRHAVIFQFKVAGSNIEVFQVTLASTKIG